MAKEILLSDHFTYRKLLRFTWPSMAMIVTTSVYSVVDGLMVSNFAGTTQFSALNLIWPFIAILGAVAFMFATGGSALVAKSLGEGKDVKARSIFSMLTYATLALSIVLGIVSYLYVDEVAVFLGAEGDMIGYCTTYGRILSIGLPAYMMQVFFQTFLVTDERPKMGMWVTIGAGVTNILLDLLFVGVWDWQLKGAAWASFIALCVGGFVPLGFFIVKHNDPTETLRLGSFLWDYKSILRTMSNGLSEFVMQISLSLVSMLYMYKLLAEAGENGVAAYGVLMYFAFTFVALFLGFSGGSAPVVSYHYGAQHKDELHGLLRKSLVIMTIGGLLITLLAHLTARPLAAIFVSYDDALLDYTTRAFCIYSLHFIVTGINIYASAFFTALNNGPVSALISLMRTMGFEACCVMLLPMLFGIDFIWWCVVIAESLSCILSISLLIMYRKRYGY